jgi:hypothetical protein
MFSSLVSDIFTLNFYYIARVLVRIVLPHSTDEGEPEVELRRQRITRYPGLIHGPN